VLQLKVDKPGQEPAPLPGIVAPASSARLTVSVQWLGGQVAPHPSWARAVTLYLSDRTTHERVLTVKGTTSDMGIATFEGLPVGTYNVHIKGPHSLQSAVAGVELTANVTTTIDMKAQVEGDVDGDNCVTVDDVVRVQTMLGAHAGIPGFDAGADLNGDGMVTMQDLSLLRSGFDMCGDLPAAAAETFQVMSAPGVPTLSQHLVPWTNPGALNRNLSLTLTASSRVARAGEIVELRVVAQSGNQPVDGASFVLRYDPTRLRPVDSSGLNAEAAEPGVLLPAVMGSWIDRIGGAVGFSSGILQGTPPQGEFTIATLRFQVLPGSGASTRLVFEPLASGHIQLTNGGVNLLAKADDLELALLP
jgi:hypothetical protein